MELPQMLQGDSLKRLIQGAVAGAVITMIVGFQWAGWTLGSTVANQVKEAEQASVVRVLAPICADKFKHAADAGANLAALMKAELVDARRLDHQGGVDDVPRLGSRPPSGGGLRESAQPDEVADKTAAR